MRTSERHRELLKKLCRRNHDTIKNLAFEFGVSERTIRRDFEVLSLTEPIYTQTGKYGGVYVVDGYNADNLYMSDLEIDLLHKLYTASCNNQVYHMSQEEHRIFTHILKSYSKPTIKNLKEKYKND